MRIHDRTVIIVINFSTLITTVQRVVLEKKKLKKLLLPLIKLGLFIFQAYQFEVSNKSLKPNYCV